MDTIHEAHLSRILEARRRRGVLGEYSASPPALPPPQRQSYVAPPPPTPPPPPPPPPPAPRRRSSTAGTQTAEERKASAAAQTRSDWSGGAAGDRPFAASAGPAPPAASDWRQSVPRGGGSGGGGAAPAVLLSNPNATLDGGVNFQSPGRVPSLAYTTPASSPRRHSSPWQPPASAPLPAYIPPLMQETRRSVDPLPPPLYIPRPRSAPREPLYQPAAFTPHVNRWASAGPAPSAGPYTSFSGNSWQTPSPSTRPNFSAPAPLTSAWRSQFDDANRNGSGRNFSSGFHFSPLSIHRDPDGGAAVMAWPAPQSSGGDERRGPSRHRSGRDRSRSHRPHHHRHHRDDSAGEDDDENEVDFPPRRRRSSSRRGSRHRSRRRSPASHAAPRRDEDPRRGRGYAPPVVYMGGPDGRRGLSPSSTEGRSRRGRSTSPGSRQRRSQPRLRQPVEEQRKFALGLPDARSTMDLRTSIETLRAGDWFYKWNSKGDVVHRRWVWVDTKSYLLVWSSRETRSTHFCGDVRLDHICQVTSRDLTSVDEDGFPKTYYVLLIETTKRVLQLATELKDKCDAWFEALNNVMGFIHRNDIAKGAMMPD